MVGTPQVLPSLLHFTSAELCADQAAGDHLSSPIFQRGDLLSLEARFLKLSPAPSPLSSIAKVMANDEELGSQAPTELLQEGCRREGRKASVKALLHQKRDPRLGQELALVFETIEALKWAGGLKELAGMGFKGEQRRRKTCV